MYRLATAAMLTSRNDHVPTVTSRLRFPSKNSRVTPTVLTPPKTTPKRMPSVSGDCAWAEEGSAMIAVAAMLAASDAAKKKKKRSRFMRAEIWAGSGGGSTP